MCLLDDFGSIPCGLHFVFRSIQVPERCGFSIDFERYPFCELQHVFMENNVDWYNHCIFLKGHRRAWHFHCRSNKCGLTSLVKTRVRDAMISKQREKAAISFCFVDRCRNLDGPKALETTYLKDAWNKSNEVNLLMKRKTYFLDPILIQVSLIIECVFSNFTSQKNFVLFCNLKWILERGWKSFKATLQI